ncbi:S-adenosyl-L-methionine-dependent methyltransferase [Atractiella rhizophila]|nr:S-adenosyl-L-methionine-dependent methyltransferase [Atractiella rhizophila]KAH8928277.1 S-adenosyl-L-methionine-dependent methyltransferase [Atractiella rhizophila]
MDQLAELRRIFNDSLDVIQSELKESNLPPFSLDPTPHPLDDPANLPSPRLYEARRVAMGSLGMIKAMISPLAMTMLEGSLQCLDQAALRVATECKISNILLSSPSGMHISEIVKKVEPGRAVNAQKLARCLRMLCATHWYQEPEENVFANTRLSLLLVYPKVSWYWCQSLGYQDARAGAMLPEVILDPKHRDSEHPSSAPILAAHNTDQWFFPYLQTKPDEMSNFAKAMSGYGTTSLEGCLADFPWETLGKATIVDVGGGRGGFTLPLLEKYKDLNLVLQDREEVVEEAKTYFKEALPQAVDNRVKFMAHDFFTPQPVTGENHHYFMRWIIHDWSDEFAIKILKGISDVMHPKSKIFLCEGIIQPAHLTAGAGAKSEKTAKDQLMAIDNSKAYQPIQTLNALPTTTLATRGLLEVDMIMMALVNSTERTEGEFRNILKKSGLKLDKVHPTRGIHWILEISKE